MTEPHAEPLGGAGLGRRGAGRGGRRPGLRRGRPGRHFRPARGAGRAALAVAHLAAARRARVGSLGRQFNLAVAIAVGQMLVAVIAIAVLMFVSRHDALLIVAITAFAGVVAVRAAQLLAGGVLRDVEAVRDGLAAVGRGERDVHIETGSRDEVAELAAQANAMVSAWPPPTPPGTRRRPRTATSWPPFRTTCARRSPALLAEAVGDTSWTRRPAAATWPRCPRTSTRSAPSSTTCSSSRAWRPGTSSGRWSVRLDELVGRPSRRCAPRPRRRAFRWWPRSTAAGGAARQPREGAARALQPDPERNPPHPGRRERDRARADAQRRNRGRGGRHGRGHRRRRPRSRVRPVLPRGSQAARSRAGTGLGLAISRAIVEAHGGRIWLEDGSLGTRIRFSLPTAA